MSQLKASLKEAKNALATENWKHAITCSHDVLKLDSDNYFAHVFLGKAYSCINQLKKSKIHYQKAIKTDYENVLAWKGLFKLLNGLESFDDIVTFDEYFDLCGEYAQVLVDHQSSQIELVNDIKEFRRTHRHCEESYLQHLRPGTLMGERLGRHLMLPEKALKKLIKIISTNEQQQVSKIVSRERLKISINDPDYHSKIDSFAWAIYQQSDLDSLYEQLINIVDDTQDRRLLEDEWLQYRLKVLKSMPKDIKSRCFDQVKCMVEDMVLVGHDSLFPWLSYFEWKDYKSLDDLDLEMVSRFIKKFPDQPLAMIMYAWICSGFSNYNIKDFYDKTFNGSDSTKRLSENLFETISDDIDETEQDKLKHLIDTDGEDQYFVLPQEEVMEALLNNIKLAQQSILAHRIISQYYIHLEEYESATIYTKAGIRLVAQNLRDIGASLLNSKREFTLSLATSYIYFEAPKNHNVALELFNKLLSDDEENIKAKMGKGLIYIEKEQWQDATDLLGHVMNRYPNNYELVSQFGWCQLHLKKPDDAINRFTYVLNNIQGTDMKTLEFKALNYWRISKCLIYKQEYQNCKVIEEAYKQLVHAVKIFESFSPAYSTLGYIYNNYFKDSSRAFKCYLKAFELDSNDQIAAKYMTEYYCNLGNWKSASTICKQLINNKKSKLSLKSSNWPYRILGIYYIEAQRESESIQWFQLSLSVSPEDVESWVGLGQAYQACGRIDASIKAFEKAMEYDPDHIYANYFNAISLSNIGEYEHSLNILKKLTKIDKKNEAFHTSLVETFVLYSENLYSQGYLSKAVILASDAIKSIEEICTKINADIFNIWNYLSRALNLFVLIQSKIDWMPIKNLVNIFRTYTAINVEEIDELDRLSLSSLLDETNNTDVSLATKFMILSSKYALNTKRFNSSLGTIRASLWYNLGISEIIAYIVSNETKYRSASIACFKKSIKFQSNTPEVWNGLGMAFMDLNYRVSQHCFIKAVALSSRGIDIWYNLSMLALNNNDLELAHNILTKVQSLAPHESFPWFGLGLISERDGKLQDSSKLFLQSFVLSNGRFNGAQIMYAKNIFNKRMGTSNDERDLHANQDFTTIAYGLDHYIKKCTNDDFAIQLTISVLERLRHYNTASKLSDHLLVILENRFEKSNNEDELLKFAILRSQLGRIQLGLKKFESAIESCELSLNILEEIQGNKYSKSILSNYVVLGLSYFFLGDFNLTLEYFKKLLENSGSRELVILISKVLYSVQTDEAIEISIQEMIEYVSKNDTDLSVMLTMASIFFMQNRTLDLQNILHDLKNLPLSLFSKDKYKDACVLIQQISKALQSEGISQKHWQRTAFLFPNNTNSWMVLNNQISNRISTHGQNNMSLKQLSESYCKLGTLRKIQRAIFLCPSNKKCLAYLKSCF